MDARCKSTVVAGALARVARALEGTPGETPAYEEIEVEVRGTAGA